MKSAFEMNFVHETPIIVGDYHPVMNFNISNSYWPPIVDMKYKKGSIIVSGPMLAVLIEICKKLKSR